MNFFIFSYNLVYSSHNIWKCVLKHNINQTMWRILRQSTCELSLRRFFWDVYAVFFESSVINVSWMFSHFDESICNIKWENPKGFKKSKPRRQRHFSQSTDEIICNTIKYEWCRTFREWQNSFNVFNIYYWCLYFSDYYDVLKTKESDVKCTSCTLNFRIFLDIQMTFQQLC